MADWKENPMLWNSFSFFFSIDKKKQHALERCFFFVFFHLQDKKCDVQERLRAKKGDATQRHIPTTHFLNGILNLLPPPSPGLSFKHGIMKYSYSDMLSTEDMKLLCYTVIEEKIKA